MHINDEMQRNISLRIGHLVGCTDASVSTSWSGQARRSAPCCPPTPTQPCESPRGRRRRPHRQWERRPLRTPAAPAHAVEHRRHQAKIRDPAIASDTRIGSMLLPAGPESLTATSFLNVGTVQLPASGISHARVD